VKPKSDKRREEDSEWLDIRLQYKLTHPCALCGDFAADVHEIAAGSSRRAAFKSRCCWLSLCRSCHNKITDDPYWTIPRQVVLKYWQDPDGVDVPRLLDILGLASTALEMNEIVREGCQMGKIGVMDDHLGLYESWCMVSPNKWYRTLSPRKG